MIPWDCPELQALGNYSFSVRRKLQLRLKLGQVHSMSPRSHFHRASNSSPENQGLQLYSAFPGRSRIYCKQAACLFPVIHPYKCLILWLHRKSYCYWNKGNLSSDISCLLVSSSGNCPNTHFWLGISETTSFFPASVRPGLLRGSLWNVSYVSLKP